MENRQLCNVAGVTEETGKQSYQLYSSRWLMLLLFFSVSTLNGLAYMDLAAVSDTCKKVYGIGDEKINFLFQIYYVVYAIIFLPAAILLNRYGLRFVICMASILTTLGMLLRAPGINYWFVLAGNGIMGAAVPFFLGIPTLLSMNWFGEHEWGVVTGTAMVANQLGLALGFLVTPFVVGTINPHHDLRQMDWALVAAGGVITPVVLIFFRSHPPTPPSGVSQRVKKTSLLEDFKSLLGNAQIWLLAIVFGIVTGLYWSTGIMLDQTLRSYAGQYSSNYIALCGIVLMTSGIPAFLLSGYLVDRFKIYKHFISMCLLMSALTMAAFTYVLQWKDSGKWAPVIVSACLGFILPFSQPAMLELAVEYTYPLPEEISGNFLIGAVQFTAFFFPELADILQNRNNGSMTMGNMCMTGSLFFCFFIFISFASTRYRRVEKVRAQEYAYSRISVSCN